MSQAVVGFQSDAATFVVRAAPKWSKAVTLLIASAATTLVLASFVAAAMAVQVAF
ncbi:MAG: hypothetical protein M3Y22_02085 [Pseudomonadota bacterium]|nr:hypothetical protein [Pseudomonadota bacterium]